MSSIIDIQTLEFDVSNKCGNTCQGCYHNKIITENTTSPEHFSTYISKFFEINQREKLDSFALYWWNILENNNLIEYLRVLQDYNHSISEYLFSTTFWEYTLAAKANQKYLLGEFFSWKKFIFQYFFHPDYVESYIESCRDLISHQYQTHIFFSVQLVEVEKQYIVHLCKSLRKFFVSIGCKRKEDLESIERCVVSAIRDRTRTENLEISIGSYTFLIMVLHPVKKEQWRISSVCGDSCSFYSSSSILSNNMFTSSMLSIEYDGAINFHNPNCIASLQKICNIMEDDDQISEKLHKFYWFLGQNVRDNPKLIDACNGCLKHNLKK